MASVVSAFAALYAFGPGAWQTYVTELILTSGLRVMQVSQKWRDVANDDSLWHRMCAQHINKKCTKCMLGTEHQVWFAIGHAHPPVVVVKRGERE